MGLSLQEAAKLVSGEVKRAALINTFARTTELMQVMPFMTINGDSYSYNVEASLPGVAFRGYNQTYTASTGVVNNAVETLKIVGGYLDCDIALVKTRGVEVRALQEEMQMKAMALEISDAFINGNSAVEFRSFDGLRYRIGGPNLFTANKNAPLADSPLSLAQLDNALDYVEGASHLIMSKAMRQRLYTAHRAGVGGEVDFTTDQFGFRVARYNGVPIIAVDYDRTGGQVIDFDEVGPAAGASTNTSIYVVRFGDGYVTGLQNGTMEVKDLGELQTDPIFRTRVEWLVGMAVMHPRACARIWGIADADVTT